MRVHRVVRPTVVLSLADVRESGRPAFFFDYGEALVYAKDELYDVYDWGIALQTGADPLPLPHDVLEHAVGIEYGWRHAVSCDCDACALHRCDAPASHRDAPTSGLLIPLPTRPLPAIAPRQDAEVDSLPA
jgi:hypothetical protein